MVIRRLFHLACIRALILGCMPVILGGCQDSRVPELQRQLAEQKEKNDDQAKLIESQSKQLEAQGKQLSDDQTSIQKLAADVDDLRKADTSKGAQVELLKKQLSDAQQSSVDAQAKLQANQAQLDSQAKASADAAAKQKDQLPLPIVSALNDLVSSCNTGIAEVSYSEKLIALKTAIATYGANLPAIKSAGLSSIVADYDMALYFWKIANTMTDSGTIELNSLYSESAKKIAILEPLHLHYDVVKDGPHYTWYKYDTTDVLSAYWHSASAQTALLLKMNAN